MDEIFIEETDDADNEVSEIDENLDLSFTSSKQAAYPYVVPSYDDTSDDFKAWFVEKNPEDVFDDLSYSDKQEALLDYKERELPPKQASKEDYETKVKDRGDGFFWVEVSKDNEHVSQGMVPASSEEEAIAYMLDKQSKVSHGESVSDYRKGLAELTIEQLEDEVYEMDQKTSALEDELEARSKTSSRTASRKRSSFDQKPLGFQRWFTKEYSDEDFDDYDEESQEGFVSEYFDSPTRNRYSKKADRRRWLNSGHRYANRKRSTIEDDIMDRLDGSSWQDRQDYFVNGNNVDYLGEFLEEAAERYDMSYDEVYDMMKEDADSRTDGERKWLRSHDANRRQAMHHRADKSYDIMLEAMGQALDAAYDEAGEENAYSHLLEVVDKVISKYSNKENSRQAAMRSKTPFSSKQARKTSHNRKRSNNLFDDGAIYEIEDWSKRADDLMSSGEINRMSDADVSEMINEAVGIMQRAERYGEQDTKHLYNMFDKSFDSFTDALGARQSKRTASRKQASYEIDEWSGFNKDYDSINEIIAYMKQAFSAQDLQYLSEGFEQGADIFDIFDEEFGDAGIFLRDLREYVSDKYGEDGADADIEEAIAGLGY